jgi:hypothetical protein
MPMSPSSPPLLARLRRHRGLWLLAIAVLMIKLASGTLCLADGPRAQLAADGAVTGMTALSLDSASADIPSGPDDCLLGEGAGCHCSCAHSIALPMSLVLSVHAIPVSFHAPATSPGFVPAMTGTELRPPIA